MEPNRLATMTDRTTQCQQTNYSPSPKSQSTLASPTAQQPDGSQKDASPLSASAHAPGESNAPSSTSSSDLTELDPIDAGLIIAALEEFAANHPDPVTADQALTLAEQVTNNPVLIQRPR